MAPLQHSSAFFSSEKRSQDENPLQVSTREAKIFMGRLKAIKT
jgi:hypothetical protein